MGVESHSCAHFPEQVKEVLLGNVATADAMGEAFEEKKGAFVEVATSQNSTSGGGYGG